jgi:hypothetical protein
MLRLPPNCGNCAAAILGPSNKNPKSATQLLEFGVLMCNLPECKSYQVPIVEKDVLLLVHQLLRPV